MLEYSLVYTSYVAVDNSGHEIARAESLVAGSLVPA